VQDHGDAAQRVAVVVKKACSDGSFASTESVPSVSNCRAPDEHVLRGVLSISTEGTAFVCRRDIGKKVWHGGSLVDDRVSVGSEVVRTSMVVSDNVRPERVGSPRSEAGPTKGVALPFGMGRGPCSGDFSGVAVGTAFGMRCTYFIRPCTNAALKSSA